MALLLTLTNRSFSLSREAQDFDLVPFQALELVLEVSHVLRLVVALLRSRTRQGRERKHRRTNKTKIVAAETADISDAATSKHCCCRNSKPE